MNAEPVAAAETYELRHRVLGRGVTPADLAVADDLEPDSGHYAVKDGDGRVVATGTVRRREAGWQIRGMATEPELRGNGLGSAVLTALIDHVRRHGGGVVWCHARIDARTLYERHGFGAIGGPSAEPVAGWQIYMERDVSGSRSG